MTRKDRKRVNSQGVQTWKAEMDFMAKRVARSAAKGKRAWSREELYEDRLSRRQGGHEQGGGHGN